MQHGRELLFKRGKRDKALKLCQQVMEKLNDMKEYDQITVMITLSKCCLSFGEFEKADDLLDRSWKLLSRFDYYNFLHERLDVVNLKCQCEIERPNRSKDKLTEALEIAKQTLSITQSFLPSESLQIFYCT
ncbi:uncharacterized protein LOC134181465 [Corticium candelabrum]|uniref:uncharacterized protein LOC134181465 n=1 Tax=Corticium candelabrum TaxID=121492 RepID=UPI002E25680F|nr:uncharacterized protein LOC134181465 [Corticium candelabrum]